MSLTDITSSLPMSHEDDGQWEGQAAQVKVASSYLLTIITKMLSVVRNATTDPWTMID